MSGGCIPADMGPISLTDIEVTCEVIKAGSFSIAARKLAKAPSSVTMQFSRVERGFGVALIDRRSRSVKPTRAGDLLAELAPVVIERINALFECRNELRSCRKSRLSIGVPPIFAEQVLAPVIAELACGNEDFEISIVHDDGASNLVKEGLHASIRIAETLADTQEITFVLGKVPRVIVAAPAYLARHGIPRSPQDLKSHNCLISPLDTRGDRWRFDGPNGRESVWVKGMVRANFPHALRGAAAAGLGILIYPEYVIREHIASGQLTRLLEDYAPTPWYVRALCPVPPGQIDPVLRRLLDLLKQRTADIIG